MTPTHTPDAPGTPAGVRPGSRADRLTRPRARDLVTEAAVEAGVCIRPVLLRAVDRQTGETTVVETRCGSTRAAVCPPCADRARRLRAQQCREGWHLTEDPTLTPRPSNQEQRDLVTERATLTEVMDTAVEEAACEDPHPLDVERVDELAEQIEHLDAAITGTGTRGALVPPSPARRRSTRRRDDAPDLPRRPAVATTLGRAYLDARTGKAFRPSLFVTLTLPSYGRVGDDGCPIHPASYDYVRAARDALHFGKLVDRWVQNLRRVAGYDVQYFAAVEPQKRGAPHVHLAIRGTLPRAVVRELTAATYASVWWPATDQVVYDGADLPVWDPDQEQYVAPGTAQPLPTWEEALADLDDALDAGTDVQPLHVARFGSQLDVKGVLAGSPDAERAIGYLVKYLVKDLGDDLDPAALELPEGERADLKARQARRADHLARLVDALRYEPCSPRCANWLRHGIQPKNACPGLRPGSCRGKAHKPSHLGYGGRRVLVSRKWTAKDLADHRHDRRAHVLAVLHAAGYDATASAPMDGGGRFAWETARPTDPDVKPRHHRLLVAIAAAHRRRAQYRAAARGPSGTPDAPSATSDAAPAA